MADLRLRVKLGDSEFEAEGSREDVIARFDVFKDLLTLTNTTPPAPPTTPHKPAPGRPPARPRGGDPLSDFAAELGLAPDVVVGAAEPEATSPYLHLNQHNWEALKKNTPIKGPGSVSPSVLAGTLLVLWLERLTPPIKPTMADVSVVLGTISLEDPNAVRSLKNCEWLQVRGSQVHPNPAERSRAVAVAKAYCAKQPIEKTPTKA